MYAICDIALGLILQRSTSFEMKEYPAEPRIPPMYFKRPDDPFYSNMYESRGIIKFILKIDEACTLYCPLLSYLDNDIRKSYSIIPLYFQAVLFT